MPPKDKEVEEGWRGLTKETIDNLGIYICNTGHYAGRVIFPMNNKYGNVSAFNTRAIGDEQPKYKYSKNIKVQELIYPPLTSIVGNKTYIYIVEGMLDAISMVQDGLPAMLNFGVNNTIGKNKIAELIANGIETIYLALDNDKAGIRGTEMYLNSDLREFFEIKLGKVSPELKPFYASGAKDYNEYLASQSK